MLFIEVNQRFGIAVRVVGMTRLLEFRAQLAVVVDFSVEDHPDALILVVDGLVAAGHVDDGEPAHCEADASAHVGATVVRAAMVERCVHPLEPRSVQRTILQIEDPDYAAHA